LNIFLKNETLSSSGVLTRLAETGDDISLPTVKRELSQMVKAELLGTEGMGRSVTYHINVKGRVLSDVDAAAYCAVEPDKRYGLSRYNFDLFSSFPSDIFNKSEIGQLQEATVIYKKNTENISPTAEKKELERLVVELAWKSSKIEGNTYTLLDTEKLILENQEAAGHSKEEGRMILNHKDAFRYIRDNRAMFTTLAQRSIEEIHTILVHDLGIPRGLRTGLVGVTGSRYRPLDNVYQITEAVDCLCRAISAAASPYEQALLALAGIGYVQPFEDGNKRTSRLAGNAILLAHNLSPLSYRSVAEDEYREAMLAFYELNSIVPLKRLFIEQYVFAAQNYAVL